jgi:hypothetical protein
VSFRRVAVTGLGLVSPLPTRFSQITPQTASKLTFVTARLWPTAAEVTVRCSVAAARTTA